MFVILLFCTMDLNIKIDLKISVCHEYEPKTTHCGQTQQPEPLMLALRRGLERAVKAKAESTKRNYATALRSLATYMQAKGCTAAPLSDELMRGYERWLLQKGICLNTVSCYMRSLRAMLAQADGADTALIEKAFARTFTGSTKTDKRSLAPGCIAQLLQLRLKAGSSLAFARDLFLFSYYAQGMPFVDLAFMRREQWAEGRITYNRHKTGQRIAIAVEPCMEEIITRYDKGGEYLFPVLTETEQVAAERQYIAKLCCYNRLLKRLATMAGLSQKLTSYVVRHSWASAAYNQNVDLAVISKALGHANPQHTLIYIREIDDERLAEANHRIIEQLREKQP